MDLVLVVDDVLKVHSSLLVHFLEEVLIVLASYASDLFHLILLLSPIVLEISSYGNSKLGVQTKTAEYLLYYY